MSDGLTKALAFFLKEFHDVRRQPQLLLILVGGPLLVLGAFASTFQNSNPFVRTVLVWPEKGVPGVDRAKAEEYIGRNLYLVKVTSDEDEAMAMLENDEVDAVQIVPDLYAARPADGARPEIRVLSRTVDPLQEGWIRSLSIGELNVINQALLRQEASAAQDRARDISTTLETATRDLDGLRGNLDADRIRAATTSITLLRDTLSGFLAALPAISEAQANIAPELYRLHRDTELLVDDLNELLAVMDGGDVAARVERLASALGEMDGLRDAIMAFVEVPTEDVVAPIKESYTNLRGAPRSLVIFYMPAVFALLLQQLAITLGALGLVREHQMGAFEMFQVAPLRLGHVFVGKAAAYIAYVVAGSAVLTLLLWWLKVPMPLAHPVQFAVTTVLLVAASTGVGLSISSMSTTDSQAVQLTMLSLLLSIFFTGFFLPLFGFQWPAWIIALLIPMTSAIPAYQNLLLKGEGVPDLTFQHLIVLGVLSYGLAWILMRRRYRAVGG